MTQPDPRFFDYAHLPEHLQRASMPFAVLAAELYNMPYHPERAEAIRHLLIAKDAAVRAALSPGLQEIRPERDKDAHFDVLVEPKWADAPSWPTEEDLGTRLTSERHKPVFTAITSWEHCEGDGFYIVNDKRYGVIGSRAFEVDEYGYGTDTEGRLDPSTSVAIDPEDEEDL